MVAAAAAAVVARRWRCAVCLSCADPFDVTITSSLPAWLRARVPACVPVLQEERARRHGARQEQTHYIKKSKVHGYVLSKFKASAAGARLSLLIILMVLATGALPREFGDAGIEAFYQCERVMGSCTDEPLPEGLKDATQARPILPSWISILRTIRDGCCSQCASPPRPTVARSANRVFVELPCCC